MNIRNSPEYVQKRYALLKTNIDGAEDFTQDNAVRSIYEVLTVLDAKASALMRLNGVLIAAAAFLLGLFGRQGGSILSTEKFDAVLVIGCAALSAVSIFVCLFVVEVSWPFLGKTKFDSSANTCDISAELVALDKASTSRQMSYRTAWRISLVACLGFLIEFFRQALHVISSV